MEIVYALYSCLGLLGTVLNIAIFILRLRQAPNNQLGGISKEHRCCLLMYDILLTLTSVVIPLGMLQDVFKNNVTLCSVMGFADLYVILSVSWTPLMTAIVLYEKERYSLRMKTYQGMTTKIVLFVVGAMILISAALVSINYAPIIEFDRERYLLCVPITFPHQTGSEYTKLLIVLTWCGLVSTWGCVIAWFVYLLRNRRSVRYVTECHRSTKSAGLQVTVSLSLWTITILLLTAYYWKPLEDLLLAAILFSILCVIGHPMISLIIHWLKDADEEPGAGLSRDMPERIRYIAPLTVNPAKSSTNFHSRWMGKFGEKVEAVIKVYHPSQRCKWLRETKAITLLRKTEHPNIVKYLWVGRGGATKFPVTNLAKDYMNVLTDPNSRMVCMQYYEQRSLRELLLHNQDAVAEPPLKYIAMDIIVGLVHLRQLHIVHNNLNSKAIFIKSMPKSKVLTAVIGGFEESDQVTLDYHRCKSDLAEANQHQASSQLDNKFAADIRSYALLLLELVAAWNKHNGQPLKAAASKKHASSLPTPSSVSSPSSMKRNFPRTRTPTKARTLSQKPRFGEIQEEPQSSLQMQKVVDGDSVAIEMDTTEDLAAVQSSSHCERSTPHAIGVIIPHGLTDSCLLDCKEYYRHSVAVRQGSSSACSTDSGYPKSLESSALAGTGYDLSCVTGKPPLDLTSKLYAAHTNNAFNGAGEQIIVGNVHTVRTNHNNNIIPPMALSDGIVSYHRAKNSLPKDILADYEEYNIQDDLNFSDEEKSIDGDMTLPRKSPSIQQTIENFTDLNLQELAERVTQDIDVFLKTHSRSNSEASNPISLNTPTLAATRLADDNYSQISGASDLTFSSSAEQPLHLRLNRELYIDRIISQRHKLNCPADRAEQFIYRPGITKAQLYYSKELASMYDIITPRLLYLNEAATKKTMRAYRSQLKMPTLNQLLVMSERCWTQEKVHSAETVLSQMRDVFTVSQ